ncbi:MAG: hypothetical protein ACREQ2_04915 [Candidatus Binatia bacterium]
MKSILIAVSGALIGASVSILLMWPKAPWALVVSGSGGRAGLNVSGLLNTIEECEILKKSHLQRSRAFIDQKDEKSVIERDGLLVVGTGWYTATCLSLHRLPYVNANLSRVEATLNEIVDYISSR